MSIKNALLKTLVNSLYKVKIEGLEKLDFSNKTILIPNHVSLLDAAVLASNLPSEVCFVANTNIAKKYASFMKNRRFITVNPLNPYSIRQMIREVNNGTPIVIFPEGRITRTGGLMKVYDGVGVIAMKAGANIIPVAINGAEKTKLSYLNEKNKTTYLSNVRVTIGNSFTIERDVTISMKEQKKIASNKVLKEMQNCLLHSRLKNNINLYNELIDSSKFYGDKSIICKDPTQSIEYKKLIIASNIFSNILKEKLKDDKNVGVLLPTSVGNVIALFALFKMGKTPAMLNFSSGEQTIIDCCETASLKTILTSKVFIEKGKLQHIIDALKNDYKIIYLEDIKSSVTTTDKLKGLTQYKLKEKSKSLNNEIILFTSGSESKPKGVILTHENIYANVLQAKCVIDFTQQDKVLNSLPMFHSFGLTAGTILPILSGIQTFLYPSPLHYKVIPELSYDESATIIFGTPTFLAGYGKNAHPYDFYSLRYAVAGAEKLKDEVRDLWLNKFGIRIIEGYGATETAPILAVNTPLLYKKDTVGNFLPGVEYKLEKIDGIENGGNLLVKGPNVMKGYLIHNKGFVPSTEWYDTGDIVEIDDNGFVQITSRLKRFAKIAGEMISLNHIEEIATKCYNNSEFASINIPDSRKGERVILYTTDKNVTIDKIRTYISENKLSLLLVPSKIEYIDKMPLLGSGKTDYVTIKQMNTTK